MTGRILVATCPIIAEYCRSHMIDALWQDYLTSFRLYSRHAMEQRRVAESGDESFHLP